MFREPGVLFLLWLAAGLGVGEEQVEECQCDELRNEVKRLRDALAGEVTAREEMWLRDEMYAAELRERDERMEAYMRRREQVLEERMLEREEQLKARMEEYLTNKEHTVESKLNEQFIKMVEKKIKQQENQLTFIMETYLDSKEAKLEEELEERYRKIEQDLKGRYEEIHAAQSAGEEEVLQEVRRQGEVLRGEMRGAEVQQRTAVARLLESLDMRAEVAELAADVR